ncbi:MAG: hypothetical protein ACW972_09180 [Promethearchaeota archaeon]|jgi:cytoskeletal protein CcmA (bactofilin family)
MEKNSKIEKRAIISSTGSLKEFEEHVSASGSANISGGKLEKSIRVSGSGKINGDLECNGLTSSGSLKGSGNLNVHGDISSAGTFNIAGFVYGDEGADFSGSTRIGNLINIQGTLIVSGSFKAGHFVRGEQGVKLSGSSTINGNLSSEKKIDIDGTTHIEGNVVGEDVFFGPSENIKRKQHYRIHGSILAKNNVNIMKTHVESDIKARDVTIGKGSEVLGTVFYINNIDIDKKVKMANEPIQINEEDL